MRVEFSQKVADEVPGKVRLVCGVGQNSLVVAVSDYSELSQSTALGGGVETLDLDLLVPLALLLVRVNAPPLQVFFHHGSFSFCAEFFVQSLR